jgi:5-hydroxyisourate hydrolase-like protein (transthyretin family)
MRLRHAAAIAALTAATATAGGLVATTTAAATAKIPTSLSIREARQVILIGDHNRISGQLRARGHGALTGATVELLKKLPHATSWTVMRSRTTNSNGVVAFLVSPRRTARFELAFRGDATHFATRSGVVTTTVVRRLPTVIGASASPNSISPGESSDIRGRLHLARSTGHPRPLPNRTLTLEQRNADGTWTALGTQTTNANGVVHFTVSPSQTTRYALFFHRTPRLRAARSNVVTVWVGQPTALSITKSAGSVNPGEAVTIAGVLTENGSALAGKAVELRARPVGSNTATTIATGTTASDGTVAFSPTPATDTVYRLLFRHTAVDATAISPAVVVLVRRSTSLSIRFDGSAVRGTLFGPHNNGLGDKRVTLQSSPAGADTWSDVASKRTGPHGGVGFAVAPATATDYRLVFAATPRYQACQSGTVTVGGS